MKEVVQESKYWQYVLLSSQRRGLILNEAINVERSMDEFLGHYFCGHEHDSRIDLLSLLLCTGNISFRSKSLIFETILQERYKIKLSEYQDLPSEIKSAIKIRNKYAHTLLNEFDHEKDLKKGQTVFKEDYLIYDKWDEKDRKLKNEKATYRVSNKQFEKDYDYIHNVFIRLNELRIKLKNRPIPKK